MGPTNDKVLAKAESISIPTEPVGSIPRPVDLIESVAKGDSEDLNLAPPYEDAIRDTIERLEAKDPPNGGPWCNNRVCTTC
jgi:5-methyltetrahydropteroyltriglutamate--homocysteine methyltransferase